MSGLTRSQKISSSRYCPVTVCPCASAVRPPPVRPTIQSSRAVALRASASARTEVVSTPTTCEHDRQASGSDDCEMTGKLHRECSGGAGTCARVRKSSSTAWGCDGLLRPCAASSASACIAPLIAGRPRLYHTPGNTWEQWTRTRWHRSSLAEGAASRPRVYGLRLHCCVYAYDRARRTQRPTLARPGGSRSHAPDPTIPRTGPQIDTAGGL